MSSRVLRPHSVGAVVFSISLHCGGFNVVNAQAPVFTKLRKVLVLDKNQGGAYGHLDSRRDFNAALASLAAENGFEVTTIGQADPVSKIAAEFSPPTLGTYQAVVFSNNDGVHAQLDSTQKANFEAYIKAGGGFVPIHAASAFISNWPWITSVLVESFYGPFSNTPTTANLVHDPEGAKDGAETKGIFKGLTAPPAFMDEFYSFRATPRGVPGVTILLTVDESTYSTYLAFPMGADHPVAWAKTEGKGRVAHISLGHSWSTNNAYAAKDGYLKKFLYGALRYAAGDFAGCTDPAFSEFNPDATKGDSAACRTRWGVSVSPERGSGFHTMVSQETGKPFVKVSVRERGRHQVSLLDVSGRLIESRPGTGPAEYSFPAPSRSGIYFVVAWVGGKLTRHRLTAL